MADFFARTFFFPFDPQLKLPVVKGDGSGVEYGPEVVYSEEISANNPTSKEAPLLVEIVVVPVPAFAPPPVEQYFRAHYFPLENVCA